MDYIYYIWIHIIIYITIIFGLYLLFYGFLFIIHLDKWNKIDTIVSKSLYTNYTLQRKDISVRQS